MAALGSNSPHVSAGIKYHLCRSSTVLLWTSSNPRPTSTTQKTSQLTTQPGATGPAVLTAFCNPVAFIERGLGGMHDCHESSNKTLGAKYSLFCYGAWTSPMTYHCTKFGPYSKNLCMLCTSCSMFAENLHLSRYAQSVIGVSKRLWASTIYQGTKEILQCQ